MCSVKIRCVQSSLFILFSIYTRRRTQRFAKNTNSIFCVRVYVCRDRKDENSVRRIYMDVSQKFSSRKKNTQKCPITLQLILIQIDCVAIDVTQWWHYMRRTGLCPNILDRKLVRIASDCGFDGEIYFCERKVIDWCHTMFGMTASYCLFDAQSSHTKLSHTEMTCCWLWICGSAVFHFLDENNAKDCPIGTWRHPTDGEYYFVNW